MDILGVDLVAVAGIITATGTAVASITKAMQARRKVTEIELAREKTKQERDEETRKLKTEVEVLKKQIQNHDDSLKEGNLRFSSIEGEIKDTNGLLREILGAIKIKFNLPIDCDGKL